MTIDQYLSLADNHKPKTMRRWVSRAKNLFQDIPIKVYAKTKDSDLLYCNSCGSMPEKVYGTPSPSDPTECEKCFKNSCSANEFFA